MYSSSKLLRLDNIHARSKKCVICELRRLEWAIKDIGLLDSTWKYMAILSSLISYCRAIRYLIASSFTTYKEHILERAGHILNAIYTIMFTYILCQFSRSSGLIRGSDVVSAAFFCLTAYLFLKVTYRLWFHPLYKFPGPKIAAATSAYKFYYSVIQDGMFL
jgi:hypothetical protein